MFTEQQVERLYSLPVTCEKPSQIVMKETEKLNYSPYNLGFKLYVLVLNSNLIFFFCFYLGRVSIDNICPSNFFFLSQF